jgi:AraC-like DNA-binding protein/mannose-6-phosphate isomerase-like protein (cupin superfamily)
MNAHPWEEKEEFALQVPFRCWDTAIPVFTFPLHWHEYYEVVFALEGNLVMSVDGEVFDVQHGDIVSIESGLLHGFFQSAPGTRLRLFQFPQYVFSKKEIEGRDSRGRESIFGGRRCIRAKGTDASLYSSVLDILTGLAREYQNRERGWRLAIKANLYELALWYARRTDGETREEVAQPSVVHTKTANSTNDQRMERVFTVIFKNFNDKTLNPDRVATVASFSRYHFERFFKAKTGMSFHAYLLMIRVSHAQEFLLKTDLPVTTIAYDCGFSSLPTFNRVFKAATGVVPSEYRENAKKVISNVTDPR